MFNVDGTTISLSRGDTGAVIISADVTLADGTSFTFGEDDRAVFSIKDASGGLVKEKYASLVDDVLMTVIPAARSGGATPITATINKTTFRGEMPDNGAVTLAYTTNWSETPATYGITVSGTPVNGDKITVRHTKDNDFMVVFYNHDTDELRVGNAYSWDVRYVIHPYYDENGRIVDGDQVITPNLPMGMNLLNVVGEI